MIILLRTTAAALILILTGQPVFAQDPFNQPSAANSSSASHAHRGPATETSDPCRNVWRYPQNCLKNCTYMLIWRHIPANDSIDFIVASKYPRRWTGVGFSSSKQVQNGDFVFGWIEDNTRYVMMDAHLPTYSKPISDKKQSIYNISARGAFHEIFTFKFTRQRNTKDSEDFLFSDDNCPYVIFPVEGGTVDLQNRVVITTEHQPLISDRPFCFKACNPSKPSGFSKIKAVPANLTSPLPVSFMTRPGLMNSPVTGPTPLPPTTLKPYLSEVKPVVSTGVTTPAAAAAAAAAATTTTTTTTTTTSTPPSTTTAAAAPQTSATPTTTTSRPLVTSTSSTSTSAKPTTSPKQATTSNTTARTATSTTTTTTSTTPAPTTTAASQHISTTSSSTTSRATTTTTGSPATTTGAPNERLVGSASEPQQTTTSNDQGQQQQQWCAGRWSHPPGCRFQQSEAVAYLQQPIDRAHSIRPLQLELSDCSYLAQWQYLESNDSVKFIVQTKTRNKWTGIGFSNSTRMPKSDAIIGIIEELTGRYFIMDTWLRQYEMPEIDQQQNALDTYGKRENGTTTVRFSRPRRTHDPMDFQFTDDSCAYFFFPTQGGSFNSISKRLNKHEQVPSVSPQRICIKACTIGNSPQTTTTGEEQQATSQPESMVSPATPSRPPVQVSTSSPLDQPKSSQQPPSSLQDTSNGPLNDLSADLDSVSPSATAPAGSRESTLPFLKFNFLSEPSLRWLAGIGCVATLLAMIVFQACFTMYRNKQAYKQALQRQSAYFNNAYMSNSALSSDQTQTPPSKKVASPALVARQYIEDSQPEDAEVEEEEEEEEEEDMEEEELEEEEDVVDDEDDEDEDDADDFHDFERSMAYAHHRQMSHYASAAAQQHPAQNMHRHHHPHTHQHPHQHAHQHAHLHLQNHPQSHRHHYSHGPRSRVEAQLANQAPMHHAHSRAQHQPPVRYQPQADRCAYFLPSQRRY